MASKGRIHSAADDWILLPGHQRLSPEDGDQKGLVTV